MLSPISGYPTLQSHLTSSIVDTWNTSARIQTLASRTRAFRLHISHAIDDFDIRWRHADLLFGAAERGLREQDYLLRGRGENVAGTEEVRYRRGSTRVRRLEGGIGTEVVREVLGYGGAPFPFVDCRSAYVIEGLTMVIGHNRALTFAEVAVAVDRLFRMRERDDKRVRMTR